MRCRRCHVVILITDVRVPREGAAGGATLLFKVTMYQFHRKALAEVPRCYTDYHCMCSMGRYSLMSPPHWINLQPLLLLALIRDCRKGHLATQDFVLYYYLTCLFHITIHEKFFSPHTFPWMLGYGHTLTHACTHACTHAHTRTHARTHTHTHTHTRTHTHRAGSMLSSFLGLFLQIVNVCSPENIQ